MDSQKVLQDYMSREMQSKPIEDKDIREARRLVAKVANAKAAGDKAACAETGVDYQEFLQARKLLKSVTGHAI